MSEKLECPVCLVATSALWRGEGCPNGCGVPTTVHRADKLRENVIAYGVWTHDWEDDRLRGLFTTREQAQRYCEAFNRHPALENARKTDPSGYTRWSAGVEEHTLQEAFDGVVPDDPWCR